MNISDAPGPFAGGFAFPEKARLPSFAPTGGSTQVPYIRISIAKPRRGEESRLEELMRKLNDMASAQDGCRESWVLKPHDNSGEIARIAIYDSEESAESAAKSASFMAIRSEIHLASEPGHVERAFFSM
jgi:quinol monooxygenase YgiN